VLPCRALSRRPPKIWLPARHTRSSHDDCQSPGCSVGRLEFGGQNTALPADNVHPSKLIGYCYNPGKGRNLERAQDQDRWSVSPRRSLLQPWVSRAHCQRRRPLQIYTYIWRMAHLMTSSASLALLTWVTVQSMGAPRLCRGGREEKAFRVRASRAGENGQ